MVYRAETSNESIILKKKDEESAPFDVVDLFRSEKDPASKFKKDFTDKDSLSFDPMVLEKEDIASKKLKGMDDGDAILQKKLDAALEDGGDAILEKKLAAGIGDKKESPNMLERVLEGANQMFNPVGALVSAAQEAAQRDAIAEKYAQLKKSKKFDEA
jgi:hypothetical protein